MNISILLREARGEDLPAIHAIYHYHVLHSTGTFEEDPPDYAEIENRYRMVQEQALPYLVAELEGQVIGFAYARIYNGRSAYRFTAEDSIYVGEGMQGKGIGKALLLELIAQCRRRGIRQMVAAIGDSDNAASIGLHRACGFTEAGKLQRIGFKFDRWLDVVYMQHELD